MTDIFAMLLSTVFYVYYLPSSKPSWETNTFIICQKKKDALKSWYFPKATHLVREGPGIHPQTGLTLKPTAVLFSGPWCLIRVNNYDTSQKEISSMRGTDKISWEFREGRRGFWMMATGKNCDKVISCFWISALEDSGVEVLDISKWNMESQGMLCVCVL